jgi:hypothetical protein
MRVGVSPVLNYSVGVVGSILLQPYKMTVALSPNIAAVTAAVLGESGIVTISQLSDSTSSQVTI